MLTSRIEAGALSLRVENVDLCAIVRDEADLHSHAAQSRGLEFAMRGCAGEVWVCEIHTAINDAHCHPAACCFGLSSTGIDRGHIPLAV